MLCCRVIISKCKLKTTDQIFTLGPSSCKKLTLKPIHLTFEFLSRLSMRDLEAGKCIPYLLVRS